MDDPLNNGQADSRARSRFLAISLLRFAGVAMIVAGILILNGAIAAPVEAGYVLAALGFIDTFFVPQYLARKWRTPRS
jgi:hypothetical protein